MYFRTINLYRSYFHTNSSLPLLEATIVKTRHASNHIPFSPVKPAQVLSLYLVPRKSDWSEGNAS